MLVNITPVLTEDYYNNLVKPWVAQHPNVTVTVEVPSVNGNVSQTFQQEIAAGDVPDLLGGGLDAGPAVYGALSDFPNDDWVVNTPGALYKDQNGVVKGVAPAVQIQSLVFYNKDAWTKAGITSTPTTLDDFTADLQKIKDMGGILPLQTAGDWVTAAQFNMMAYPSFLANGQPWDDITSGKQTFATSTLKPYLDAYSGWVKSGFVDPNALGVAYEDSITQFTSGKAATYIMGSWIVPTVDQANPSFETGVFATPSLDGQQQAQMGNPAQAWWIPKDSKNQDVAMDLIKYLVTDKAALTAACTSEGNFAKGITYDASPLQQQVIDIYQASSGIVTPDFQPTGYQPEEDSLIQSLYTGSSADDVVNNFQSWWASNVS